MKSKSKVNLVGAALLGVLLSANLLSFRAVSAKAEQDETHYSSGAFYAVSAGSETVYYTDRQDSYIETIGGVPLYKQHTGLSNSCGATAGAIVVGFYDKYYEELIPNYTSYFTASGNYKKNDKTYVPALMEDLYTRMRINVDDAGVTESECLSGLRSYVESKGRSISYSSLKSSSQINENSYIDSINSNKPVIIFAGRTEVFESYIPDTNSEKLSKMVIADNHIFIGYGYYTVKYFNGSNNFRTDTYLAVACGIDECNSGFIRISSTSSSVSWSWFMNAYSVTIS